MTLQIALNTKAKQVTISTHTSRVGRFFVLPFAALWLAISIHTPRVRRLYPAPLTTALAWVISTHVSRVGHFEKKLRQHADTLRFQPMRPAWDASMSTQKSNASNGFQPMRPAWSASGTQAADNGEVLISTHAPRVERFVVFRNPAE